MPMSDAIPYPHPARHRAAHPRICDTVRSRGWDGVGPCGARPARRVSRHATGPPLSLPANVVSRERRDHATSPTPQFCAAGPRTHWVIPHMDTDGGGDDCDRAVASRDRGWRCNQRLRLMRQTNIPPFLDRLQLISDQSTRVYDKSNSLRSR